MPMIPKDWHSYPPNTDTPVNRASLQGLEGRVGNYVGGVGLGPGVAQGFDFFVQQHGAGDMTVSVGVANTLQVAFIAADLLGSVERYEYAGALLSATIGTADPSNPRIDRVVLVPGVVDSQTPSVAVIAGTPTPGATLDNLTGAAVVPVNRLLLADVLVGTGVASILTAAIQDRRGLSYSGVSSNAAASVAPVDEVVLQPHWLAQGLPTTIGGQAQTTTAQGTNQYGCLTYLPRRIKAVTRLRWRYAQFTGVALTGNYNIGIYEPGGRLIVATGVVAYTGGVSTYQNRAEVIAATDFEAGAYVVVIGNSALAGNGCFFHGLMMGVGAAGAGPTGFGVGGVGFINGGGLGTGLGTRLNTYMADVAGQVTAFQTGGIPTVTLATG